MAFGPVNVPGAPASTSRRGVVQLSTSTTSSSTTLAATASAVKSAYDKATEVETALANLTIPVLSADPESPTAGQIWILSS